MSLEDRPWMVALEEQFLALHALRDAARGRRKVNWTNYGIKQTMTEFLADIDKQVMPDLPRAETFAWSAESVTAVHLASRTFPDDAVMTMDQLPAHYGWWWTGAASLPDLPHVSAILWGVRDGGMHVWTFSREESTGGFTLPCDRMVFRFGYPMRTILSTIQKQDDNANPIVSPLLRFFFAGCVWLQQHILLTSDGHVERHCRRRIEREHQLTIEPTVKVVQLRRTVHEGPPTGTHRDVNWSCRWVVDGHWRRQAYAHGEHRAIYINPHVKGPSDKPLRVPTRTVFEVDR